MVHGSAQRVLSIGVFIRDRDMGSVVADMRAKVNKAFKLETGYNITWAGEFENQERAMARLSWVVPLSILIIFLFLFDAFQSLRSALLIIVNIPFAMIGGIFALLVTGIPLSVSAAIGFIALFGISVMEGIILISYYNQLIDEGTGRAAAIRSACEIRLRPAMKCTTCPRR